VAYFFEAIMDKFINIAQIEQAINFWRATAPELQDGINLEVNTSNLADVYGNMIFNRQNTIMQSQLRAEQLCALNNAFV